MGAQTWRPDPLCLESSAFNQGLKSKVGRVAAKAVALRINLNQYPGLCRSRASFVPEVIKTFDQLLDLLLQKVTAHKPVAMQTEREPTPPHPIDEFCSLRCDVHMASHKQCTVAPESTAKKYSGAH
jgi:hypothetical protein